MSCYFETPLQEHCYFALKQFSICDHGKDETSECLPLYFKLSTEGMRMLVPGTKATALQITELMF
jgi:hypothetical protein